MFIDKKKHKLFYYHTIACHVVVKMNEVNLRTAKSMNLNKKYNLGINLMVKGRR